MKQEIIRLGSECNQKCLFCNQEEVFSKKTKRQILHELLLYRKKGVCALIISGGEPTLFKEELLFTLLTAKKLGFKQIELQSNAILLSDYNYSKELLDSGLDFSMISLHYFNSDISDTLTQAPGTFDKTFMGIKNLINVGVSVSLNIVINKKNYKNIVDYLSFIKNNIKGFTNISLSIVVPGKLTKKNNLLPKYTELAKYLNEAYSFCIDNDIVFDNPGCGIPVCYIKKYYKYSLEYENYKNEDLYNEFILDKNKINKVKTDDCKKCIFDRYCLGHRKGYVDIYGFDGLEPVLEI